jgi:predicted dehydrogenase
LKIGIIGCGYVSDHYMETLNRHSTLELAGLTDLIPDRAQRLATHYGAHVYPDMEAMIRDPEVQLIVNLTEPENHFAVSKACIEAGKHVYSEKPLSMDFEEAKALVELAEKNGVLLSSAPCSVLSESAQTLWHAVNDGAIGKPRLVYAELDDNPVYLMHPEGWRNARGTPWPYLNEYEVGCTIEHAGYYLTWLAAMFGPADSVTAFSSCVVPDKSPLPLNPADTPDFSVACIKFRSGVVARLTCSIVAPYDHRLQIVGDKGVLTVDECWQYGTPVYLEQFSQTSLNARKSRTVRASSLLRLVFGIRGRRQKLVARPYSPLRQAWRDFVARRRSLLGAIMHVVSKRELVSMDFFRGVAEMANAIEGDRSCLLPPDFVLHVVELTLATQNARTTGSATTLTTTFKPLRPMPKQVPNHPGFTHAAKPGRTTRALEWAIARLHKH